MATKMPETKRLRLRSFAREDFAAVYSNAGSVENTVYMLFPANTEEQTRAFIDMAMAAMDEKHCANFHYDVEAEKAQLSETTKLRGRKHPHGALWFADGFAITSGIVPICPLQ